MSLFSMHYIVLLNTLDAWWIEVDGWSNSNTGRQESTYLFMDMMPIYTWSLLWISHNNLLFCQLPNTNLFTHRMLFLWCNIPIFVNSDVNRSFICIPYFMHHCVLLKFFIVMWLRAIYRSGDNMTSPLWVKVTIFGFCNFFSKLRIILVKFFFDRVVWSNCIKLFKFFLH